MIGIIAGVGPYAGLDLLSKILAQTEAVVDQDHLAIVSISQPGSITDRTAFLLGQTAINPAEAIVQQLLKLEQIGAEVAGIPCNTAHAPPIFTEIVRGLNQAGSNIRLLHMIAEVGRALRQMEPDLQRVGVLSTTGTMVNRVYPLTLEPMGFELLAPDERLQQTAIHPAIYDPAYGLKACGQATKKARENLLAGVKQLQSKGAQAIVLGCTEIPLAIQESYLGETKIVDPTLILARALIAAVDPNKLKKEFS